MTKRQVIASEIRNRELSQKIELIMSEAVSHEELANSV